MGSALPLSGVSVLVVEDEPVIELWLAEILAESGATVLEAIDGEEALHLIERHPEIRLMIADLGLPGMSGEALTVEARRRIPGLQTIFITGGGTSGGQADNLLLQKPFSADDAVRAVSTLLSRDLRSSMIE